MLFSKLFPISTTKKGSSTSRNTKRTVSLNSEDIHTSNNLKENYADHTNKNTPSEMEEPSESTMVHQVADDESETRCSANDTTTTSISSQTTETSSKKKDKTKKKKQRTSSRSRRSKDEKKKKRKKKKRRKKKQEKESTTKRKEEEEKDKDFTTQNTKESSPQKEEDEQCIVNVTENLSIMDGTRLEEEDNEDDEDEEEELDDIHEISAVASADTDAVIVDTADMVATSSSRPSLTRSLTARFQEGMTDFFSHLGGRHGLEPTQELELGQEQTGMSNRSLFSFVKSTSPTDVAPVKIERRGRRPRLLKTTTTAAATATTTTSSSASRTRTRSKSTKSNKSRVREKSSIRVRSKYHKEEQEQQQQSMMTKVIPLWFQKSISGRNPNSMLTKQKSLASMLTHPLAKQAVRRKLEKQISIIPGTRSRRVRRFPKSTESTGTTTKSNNKTTSDTIVNDRESINTNKSKKKKKKKKKSSSSHDRNRRSSENDGGSKRRGQRSSSHGPLHTDASTEEKSSEKEESQSEGKPELRRSNSGSALDLLKKEDIEEKLSEKEESTCAELRRSNSGSALDLLKKEDIDGDLQPLLPNRIQFDPVGSDQHEYDCDSPTSIISKQRK